MIGPIHFVGRYGAYIWPAYGVSLVGLIVMTLDTALRARRWRRKADRQVENQSFDNAEQP